MIIPYLHCLFPDQSMGNRIEILVCLHKGSKELLFSCIMDWQHQFVCSLHLGQEAVLLLCIKARNIFAHSTCGLDLWRNRKDSKNLCSWHIKVSIDPACNSYRIDENTLKEYQMLLNFIGDPYRKVTLITLSSAIKCSDLVKKDAHKFVSTTGKYRFGNVQEDCVVAWSLTGRREHVELMHQKMAGENEDVNGPRLL